MKAKLLFTADRREIPIDYRKHVIHFMKKSISAYDKELFEQLYSSNTIKPFSFSVFFKDANILSQTITLDESNSFTVYISVGDSTLAFKMLNSFIGQLYKDFSSSGFVSKLTSVVLMPTKNIVSDKILIKFLSPLVLQTHNLDKDYFYSVDHQEFRDVAQEVISRQLVHLGAGETDKIKITPTRAKKTVVKFYEKKIECSNGEFLLEGSPDLLQFLYESGVGSKRSCGFGLFEVIGGVQ